MPFQSRGADDFGDRACRRDLDFVSFLFGLAATGRIPDCAPTSMLHHRRLSRGPVQYLSPRATWTKAIQKDKKEDAAEAVPVMPYGIVSFRLGAGWFNVAPNGTPRVGPRPSQQNPRYQNSVLDLLFAPVPSSPGGCNLVLRQGARTKFEASPNINIFRSDDGIHGQAAVSARYSACISVVDEGSPFTCVLASSRLTEHANGVVILAVAVCTIVSWRLGRQGISGVGKVFSLDVDVLEDAAVASAPRLVVFALRPASRVSPAVMNKSQLCDLETKSPRFVYISTPASGSASSMPSLALGLAESRPEGSAPIAVPRVARDQAVAPGMIQDQWKPRDISTCDGLFRVSM
ncbi:hypothetical protein CH63R_01039 [Colletotrichum higginsianum IMI 349063]|uniref:Uncharacterized protein n=1 Tax=Colletotrichum higginsianum (strain IMI 349063) TaxID=759273 RepID=A0A1B7YUY7_COLHI|nr:hypothetical protein CH63R_01039 [Colletotrichum higginsianum IMI 349063]OBR15859.1 hypothetical protein CH63R_01039 [Colletotrichum higginsianum IMI 349063]